MKAMQRLGRLIIFALLLPALPVLSQVRTPEIPDGTMGEVIENPDDSVASKGKRWRLFKTGISTVKFGFGFLYEFTGYSQDAVSKQQMQIAGTPLENTFKVRDFRIVASGKFKTKRIITWKAGFMYDGATDTWLVRESGLMFALPKLSGHLFVGRTKEGVSLNKVMNGYAGWTMERQMALDVFPILADGAKLLGFLPKQRVLWNIGVYNDFLSEKQTFSTYQWQFASRVGWLPMYKPNEKKLIHLGVSYRYGVPLNDRIRVRSKPEASAAPYFVDTGTFSSDYSNHYGFEAYYSAGPLLMGTESYLHAFHSVTEGNPVFTGADAFVSYLLTGESRPYNTTSGIYGFVPVKKPVFEGGWGAWEVLVRYSTLDLTSGNLQGGKLWRITPMINWYMSKDVRLEFAYGYGMMTRYDLKGATQFFQCRVQFAFL